MDPVNFQLQQFVSLPEIQRDKINQLCTVLFVIIH